MGSIRIGTSGWSYPHWQGLFYPASLARRQWLAYYAEHFNAAEINAAFYRIPKPATFRAWAGSVPEDFVFTVKASRYITHMKKLKDPAQSLSRLLDPLESLGDRLGPILFQLPPRWNCNIERLRAFLAALPDGHRYAFEFRDTRWFRPGVFEALREAGAALCFHQIEDIRAPLELTTDFVYIRLHGPDAAYTGCYEEPELSRWADRIYDWARTGRDVFCFFDNDADAQAPANAARLRALAG